MKIRPLISERAKTVSARKREEEQQSFSVPEGLPEQGWMEGIACQLVHIKCSFLKIRNVGLSPEAGIQ